MVEELEEISRIVVVGPLSSGASCVLGRREDEGVLPWPSIPRLRRASCGAGMPGREGWPGTGSGEGSEKSQNSCAGCSVAGTGTGGGVDVEVVEALRRFSTDFVDFTDLRGRARLRPKDEARALKDELTLSEAIIEGGEQKEKRWVGLD